MPTDIFTKELTINTISAFVAMKEAVVSFKTLPKSVSKTFLYTGNILNLLAIPQFLSLGVGKSATSHLLDASMKVSEYTEAGMR